MKFILKVLSKERHDGSIRLNESRVESVTIAEEKDMTILCLNENVTALETSKETFQKQLLQKSDETTALSKILKKEIDSGNNLKILSKVNQDERTRLHELREKSETMN